MKKHKTNLSIYTTKFVPQQTRTKLIERDRLLNKLIDKNSINYTLSLVVAPSGYGKSTLLAQFMSYCLQVGDIVCWISLDDNDNNEDVFITYLIESYCRSNTIFVDEKIFANQFEYPNTNPIVRLQQFLSIIEETDERTRIILDDFQVINSKALLKSITWLISKAPKNLSIYIISKSEPQLKIVTELRAKNNLLDIKANQLNFTVEESQTFFSKKEIKLDDVDIKVLHDKTEGWVAATQLFSLVIQNQEILSRAKQRRFIENISGSDKDIVKYLGDSIFNLQNDKVKNFFICTGVLTRFNADLCIAICGDAQARDILEYVCTQGLFIFDLDRKKEWFRYHHLFREYLLSELDKLGIKKYQELTMRAAGWFEDNDYMEEAIDYYLLSRSYSKATTLISQIVVEAVQYRGNHNVLLKWTDRLPLEYMLKVPNIAICYAWSLLFTREFEHSEKIITALTKHKPTSSSEQTLINYNVEMLYLIKGVMRGNFNRIRRDISEWLEKWTNAPVFERGVVFGLLGATCIHTLEFSLARNVLSKGKVIFEQIYCDYGIAWIDSLYALVLFKQGHLLESKNILVKALYDANSKMGEHSFSSSLINIKLSQIYCDLNDNHQAMEHLNRGFSSIDKHGVIDTAQIGYIIKARLQYREQLKSEAYKILVDGESYGRKSKFLSFEVAIISERIRLLLRSNDIKQAIELFGERGFDCVDFEVGNYSPFEKLQIMSLQVRIDLVEKNTLKAIKLLNDLMRECKYINYNQLNEHLMLLYASANYSLGKKNQAFRVLDQVLRNAELEKKLGLFNDESYHLKPLFIDFFNKINEAIPNNRSENEKDFIEKIRDVLSIKEKKLCLNREIPSNKNNLFLDDKLTKREKEILLMLKQGLSNKELAEGLFVSESTIKWHLSRIYIKINAKNRLDAVKVYFGA